jgi:hypothetical protein
MEHIKNIVKRVAKDTIKKHVKPKKPQKEKKEKPKKDKTPKETGSRQKQKQNQTVNATVNNNGEGDGGGRRKPALTSQFPLNIFDPSLISPHYGINDRQPVNPPDPENVDMTELLTRMASQFQSQTQTPNKVAEPISIKIPVPQPVETEPMPIKILAYLELCAGRPARFSDRGFDHFFWGGVYWPDKKMIKCLL